MSKPAILIFNASAQGLAETVHRALPEAELFAFKTSGHSAFTAFDDAAGLVKTLFGAGRPIIGLCAAGILIRLIAPLLSDKRREPPVIAISADGMDIVPLLGGLTGAAALCTTAAEALGGRCVVTAAGQSTLGRLLEQPPLGWSLPDKESAKAATRRLLEGARLSLHGEAPWLADLAEPAAGNSPEKIEVLASPKLWGEAEGFTPDLHFVPQVLAAWVKDELGFAALARELDAQNYHREALGLLASESALEHRSEFGSATGAICASPKFHRRAKACQLTVVRGGEGYALYAASEPIHLKAMALDVPDLAVISLGPGAAEWLAPEAQDLLVRADVWIGYQFYLDQAAHLLAAGGLTSQAVIEGSDNRVERERAQRAIDLAREGKRVAVISSGDAGIFGMAAAVLEVYEEQSESSRDLDLKIVPGLSAFQAAGGRFGAPFGHDFAILSLSDILKPWAIIERRIAAMLDADLTFAVYNPASKRRREPLARMKALIIEKVGGERRVLLGRNLGRANESLTVVTAAELDVESVDMSTLVIVGSSEMRGFSDAQGQPFWFTPRSYPKAKA